MIRDLRSRFWFALFCTVHRLPLSVQVRWQSYYLRRLVTHHATHVSLYRTLLREKGVSPSDVRSCGDLDTLPVTRKQTFIGKLVESYTDSSHPTRGFWYVTSGTSGVPFRFLMSEHNIIEKFVDFASLRFLWWRGIGVRSLSTLNIARIKIRAPESEHRLFVPVEDYLTNPRRALECLHTFAPDVLAAYPSILLDMVGVLLSNPSLKKPLPRFVLSFGEMLAPSVRKRIETVLGCEVYDRYGLEEIGVIGVECAMHKGFHINTESVILEVVDEHHKPVAHGTEGTILATDLFNFGMPFIRYETGDRGILMLESCECGLSSPRVMIRGRYSAFLSFPHRRIHHLEFDGAMDGFMNNVLQYQVAKINNQNVVVRVVPGPGFSISISSQIVTQLKKLVGGSVRITVEVSDAPPLTQKGKSRIVVDLSNKDRQLV